MDPTGHVAEEGQLGGQTTSVDDDATQRAWEEILAETKARKAPASDEARASGEAVVVEEPGVLERVTEAVRAWRDRITSPIAIDPTTGDAVADELRRVERSKEALREVGRTGTAVGETALAATAVSDVATVITGRDINDREANRLLAGVSLATAGTAALLKYGRKIPFLSRLFRKGDDVAGFGGVTARTSGEASFLRNVSATFSDSRVYSSARRFDGQIVIQRSDIPWSVQNVRLAARGNTPFVRNSSGQWERINLHHVGRKEGRLIEVVGSQNRYDNVTGGPLHIPGPGGPARDRAFNVGYWQQRLQDAVETGQVPDEVLRNAGL